MALKYLSTALHAIAAVHLSYAAFTMFHAAIPSDVLPIDTKFSGKCKYLTFWNICIESAYFWYALVDSLINGFGDNENKSIRKVRDYWFISIVFPISFFVSFTFWVLFLINRELVMPKTVDPYFPLWLNHSVHTFILIYTILELLTSYHKTLTPSPKHCYGLWSVTVPYLLWCNVVYFQCGLWVYPVLAEMNWPGRILFFIACLAASTVFLFIGYHLNNTVWKKRIQKKSLQINS